MSQPFDASAKLFMKWGIEDWLALLGETAPGQVVELDSDISSVSARVDKIVRIDCPEPHIEHLEIQSSLDPNVPIRLCRYRVIIHYQQRLPVNSSVVLLSPAADSRELTGLYVMHDLRGSAVLQYRYQVIRLWEIPARQLCQAGIGVLGLAPLGKMDEGDLPVLIEQMKVRAEQELEPSELSEFWAGTAYMMGLIHPGEYIKEILKGATNVEESSFAQMLIETGRQRGRVEGKEEGREEGRRDEAIRTLIRILKRRFQNLDESLKSRIESLTDIEFLEQLQDLAIDAASLDLVKAEIQKRGE